MEYGSENKKTIQNNDEAVIRLYNGCKLNKKLISEKEIIYAMDVRQLNIFLNDKIITNNNKSNGKFEPGLPGTILQKIKPSSIIQEVFNVPSKKLVHEIISHGLL